MATDHDEFPPICEGCVSVIVPLQSGAKMRLAYHPGGGRAIVVFFEPISRFPSLALDPMMAGAIQAFIARWLIDLGIGHERAPELPMVPPLLPHEAREFAASMRRQPAERRALSDSTMAALAATLEAYADAHRNR